MEEEKKKAIDDVKLNKIVQRFLQLIGINTQAAHAIDITDKISLAWSTAGGGANLDWLAATPVKYTYLPGAGVVFFQIELQYRGAMAEGEQLIFMHNGGYAPVAPGAFGMARTGDPSRFSLKYETSDGETKLYVHANKAVDEPAIQITNYLTGWYFCDGE